MRCFVPRNDKKRNNFSFSIFNFKVTRQLASSPTRKLILYTSNCKRMGLETRIEGDAGVYFVHPMSPGFIRCFFTGTPVHDCKISEVPVCIDMIRSAKIGIES